MKKTVLILIPLILLAFALRLPGLDWGMPAIGFYASDNERAVKDAVAIVNSRDLNPHWFGHPASTVNYTLAIAFALTNRLDRALGYADRFVAPLFRQNPTPFYALGRVLTALLGAALVPLAYALGRRSASLLVGLVAAGLVAISPLHMSQSHVVRPDAAVAFLGALGVWACAAILREPKWRYVASASAAFGLGISSKYYVVLLTPLLPLALFWRAVLDARAGRRFVKAVAWDKLIGGTALVVLTFALTTPYFFLDFPGVVQNMQFVMGIRYLGATSLSPLQNVGWYLFYSLPNLVGPVAAVLAVAGIYTAIRHKKQILILYIAAALIFLAGMAVQTICRDTYILPILALIAVLAGVGFERIVSVLRRAPRGIAIGGAALLLLGMAWPVYGDVRYNVDRVIPNTRQFAQEWVEANLSADSQIVAESYTFRATRGRFARITYVWAAGEQSLAEYCQDDTDYIILTENMIRRYLAEETTYPEIVANYARIQSQFTLVKTVQPEPWKIAGPTISVYQVRGCP